MRNSLHAPVGDVEGSRRPASPNPMLNHPSFFAVLMLGAYITSGGECDGACSADGVGVMILVISDLLFPRMQRAAGSTAPFSPRIVRPGMCKTDTRDLPTGARR